MFWQLPRAAVHGILNGMEDEGGSRPALGSDGGGGGSGAEVEAFFASKAAAKLAFQAAKGLQAREFHVNVCISILGINSNTSRQMGKSNTCQP